MRRRLFYFAVALLVPVLGVFVWRFGTASGLALSLGVPSAEPWLSFLWEAPAREEIVIPVASGRLDADLYRPPRPRGRLLLVHGLSRSGRRQPDLERLARLLAGRGLLVVVPQFEGLAAFRLTGREVDDIRVALRHTAALPLPRAAAGDSVAVAGFSFGAGPALIAAADVPDLRVAGSFGGYADLLNVLVYVTTGVYEFEGHRHVQRQEEYNRWKLLALLVGVVADEGQRGLLGRIAEQKLANPGADTAALEAGLGSEGSAVLALVVNRRLDRVAGLVAELPNGAREALGRLSPLAALPRIRGRLLIAHGMADDSIPYTESLRLAAAAGDRVHVALFETFHHTGPQSLWGSLGSRVGDGWRLVGVVDELLGR